MRQRQDMFTVTLHWLVGGAEQTTTIVCEDSPPAQLIPLLVHGCGLPAQDEQGRLIPYMLRLESPAGRPLHPAEVAGRQGVRSGSHLWLVERDLATSQRCLLSLSDGSELALPHRGVALTRGWLLQALALLNPEAHRRELVLLEQRASRYRYVSNRPHCHIAVAADGGWAVTTERSDVATLLNGAPLVAGRPELLQDGDHLTLGEHGLCLPVILIGERLA